MTEKNPSQDSLNYSSSTNISFSESILQDINTLKNKNLVIISKNFE